MDILNKMVMAACFCGIAMSLCDMISPDEKFRKQLHFIFSLVFAIGITAPFANIIRNFSAENGICMNISEYNDIADENDMYKKYLKKMTEENISESLKNLLESNGISVYKICVETDISDSSCISIIKTQLSCDDFEKGADIIKSETGAECELWQTD